MASSIASVVANPFFVLKIRFQTDMKGKGYINYTRNMIAKEGIFSLQRGLVATLFNNTKLGVQLPFTYYLKDKIGSGSSSTNVVIASFISKTLTSSVFYPLDLLRVQQRASTNNKSLVELGKNIVKTTGFRGLYRGLLLYSSVSVPNYVLMMLFMNTLFGK
jgi:hypothetical protein